MLLDQHLSADVHILNVPRKLLKFAPIMYESRQYCTDKCIRLFHNCLVYSNLTYCNSMWGFCKKSAFQPLMVIKKKSYVEWLVLALRAHSRFLQYLLSVCFREHKCIYNRHVCIWMLEEFSFQCLFYPTSLKLLL